MSKEIRFKYFYNGKVARKSEIDWTKELKIKVEGDIVFITSIERLN